MKKFLLLALCVATISCGNSKKFVVKPTPNLTDFQNTITEEGLFVDLAILASDSLEGRDTGSEGERKAANYLANRYNEFGLTPIGDNNTYFQNYTLERSILDSIKYELLVNDEIVDQSVHSSAEIGNFSTIHGGESRGSGEVVFIGYGMYDEENAINHFDIDVSGKWLFGFYDRNVSSFSTMQSLINEQNAVGAILIMGTDTTSFLEQAVFMQNDFGQPSGLALPYLIENENNGSFNRIHPQLAAHILGVESLDELSELENKIKTNPASFEPYAISASLHFSPFLSNMELVTRNVVALIEGTHPELKDEVIVLSAHYDHVGIGSADANGDTIYNGADDDGSGNVGLLHTAQALSTAKSAGADLKRSVLFLHVSGEERGLLGSRYYSDHPLFSIDNTVANLNVDMIGRRDDENPDNPNYVYIIGGKIISSGLQEVVEQANQLSVNIELSDRYNNLNDPQQFYRRSDHWNFGRLGVPFIFYFNGIHEDYHRPSDEIEKIDFEALKKRTQLLYMTTALLANSDARPIVDNQEFIERTQQ